MLKVPAKHIGQKTLRVQRPDPTLALWFQVQVEWFSEPATWYA